MTSSDMPQGKLHPPAELLGQGLRMWAPAKINLNLLVGPRRADDYHGVDSIVCKITLYDRVDLAPLADGKVELSCRGADCGAAEMNLAVRAARLMLDQVRRGGGLSIDLQKAIPPGAGLGGGSSDAAAVLRGLNHLWRLGWPDRRLAELGAALGSDVPLFLGPRASRVTGRGELLEPVQIHDFAALLCLPDVACATAQVYKAFDGLPRQDMPQLDLALLSQPPSKWRGLLVNQLDQAACVVAPALGELRSRLAKAASAPAHMSGSGSSLFVLCDDAAEAAEVFHRLPPDIAAMCMVVSANSW